MACFAERKMVKPFFKFDLLKFPILSLSSTVTASQTVKSKKTEKVQTKTQHKTDVCPLLCVCCC